MFCRCQAKDEPRRTLWYNSPSLPSRTKYGQLAALKGGLGLDLEWYFLTCEGEKPFALVTFAQFNFLMGLAFRTDPLPRTDVFLLALPLGFVGFLRAAGANHGEPFFRSFNILLTALPCLSLY